METINIADLELLTPGSTWVRSDGRTVRYLCTTNTALPEKMQAVHPSMVVYADENDNILSVPLEKFLHKRKFHNVDPGLEARLANLLAFDGSATDSDFSLEGDDDLVVAGEGDSEIEIEIETRGDGGEEEGEIDDTPYNGTGITYIQSDAEAIVGVDAAMLSRSTVSYQQFPQIESQSILHTLVITGVAKEVLIEAFSNAENSEAVFSKFTVATPDGQIEVDWESFIGVYPCVYDGSTMYQLMFRTSAEFGLVANLSIDNPVMSTAGVESPVAVAENIVVPEEVTPTTTVADELVID